MSDVLLVNRQEPSQLLVPVEAVKADLVTKTGTIIYVPLASTTHPGIVQVGDYLTITGEGVLSLADSATLKEYLDINNKVDKVDGKGLSTNDYTTEDKNKLASLENYDDTILSGRIDDIELVIPTGASSDNKLTTVSYVTAFVNSSIATNTATFRGTYETVNDLPTTTDVPDLKSNDYAFVIDNGEYKRYKYNGSWTYEYTLNNSSYTASQWAAINSGITSEKVALIVPVNNSTITFTQGGVTKGSITLNQSSDATIALDAGGGIVTDVQVDSNSQVSSGVVNLLTVNNNYNSSTNKLVTANELIGKLDKLSTKNNVNCEIDNSNAKLSIECYPTSNRLLGTHLFIDDDSIGALILDPVAGTASGFAGFDVNKTLGAFSNGVVIDNVGYETQIASKASEGISLTFNKANDTIGVLSISENVGQFGIVNDGTAQGLMIQDKAAFLLYLEDDVLGSQVSVSSSGVALGVGDLVNNTENMVLITPTDFTWNGKTIATVDQIQSAVQSDWNQSDSSALDYIKNKPSIPSISGLESTTNKVTSLSSGSTDTQYPSAKLVYDELLLKQDVINANNKLDYSLLTNTPTLGSASTKDVGTSSGNVPILDSNGKLSSSVLPAIAITDTFVVSTEAAMLALTAEVGDVCVRTDLNKTYILKEDGASTLSHWQEMLTPTTGVTSVNGQTGAVTLTIPTTTDSVTQDSSEALTSGGAYTALNNKMDKANPTGTGSFSLNRKDNTTIGNYSVAEGYKCSATGNYSHAEGYYTEATGNYSHAEGETTRATGTHSHTEGYLTNAGSYYSHAEGCSTQARGRSQHVFGEYNVVDSYGSVNAKGMFVEIVGNGNDVNRSNARTLDWSGNEWLAGKITPAGGISDGNNATYKLVLPDTTSWTANKTIATTDQIPTIKTLDTTATTAQSTNASEAIAGSGTVTLHKVSKTGTSTDLVDANEIAYHDDTVTTANESTFADNYYTKTQIIDLIYPIGSVFITVNNVNPSTYLPNTNWEAVASGKTLWTTTTDGEGGSEIAAGLPNITGSFGANGHMYNNHYATGAFSAGVTSGWSSNNGAASDGGRYDFNASLSNGIYGNSDTVQPPAIKVYMWKRIPLASS